MSDRKNLNQDDRNARAQVFGEEPDPSGIHRTSDEIYTGQEYQSSVRKDEKEKKDSVIKDILILVMITLVAGCLLGAAYGVTKNPIAQAQAKAEAKAQKEVTKDSYHFETLYSAGASGGDEGQPISEALIEKIKSTGLSSTSVTKIDGAYSEDGKLAGYVITARDPDGYGGDVELMCGISPNEDGSVTLEGISFLTLTETAGMGMRAKEDEFKNQFSGKKLKEGELILYTKSGASKENEIDAISGCTITTSAVTDDVNAALITAWELIGDGKEAQK